MFKADKLLWAGVFCLSLVVSGKASQDQSMAKQIHSEMESLASDAMQGRGSGTQAELAAATYLASELHRIGIEPAGDHGGYGVGKPVDGDSIYNGADDDASGCVAVLQLAQALAGEERPKRTVVFAFFGSEETGGQGDQYFLQHPPVPLANIVANLEFEMIGRPDSAVKPDELWLTGYDRSNLGPELAKHGAKLVADPHPAERFFQRSDNFALAKRGIIAQTVSSYGLHKDYHRPSDDVAHIDFIHMEQAIRSMVGPVKWLADSDFKPEWVAGKKP